MNIKAKELDVGDCWRVYINYSVNVHQIQYLPTPQDPVWVQITVKNENGRFSELFIKPNKKVWIEE